MKQPPGRQERGVAVRVPLVVTLITSKIRYLINSFKESVKILSNSTELETCVFVCFVVT